MQGQMRTPSDAFFAARVRDGHVNVEGVTSAHLGHRMEPVDGRAGGNWVEWRWDGTSLGVASDRFGAYPLFYFATDERVIVSPSIDRILAAGAPRVLDLDALAAFLAIGYYLDLDTPFRDIRKLPAGGRLTWKPGQLNVSGGPRSYPVQSISHAQVVEGIIEGVRAAVARCVSEVADEAFVMPVSGGRDSRHLLLELRRQGHPPRLGVSAEAYPSIGGHEDARVAALLCSKLGIEHRSLPVPPALVRAEMRKNRMTSYGSDQHAWNLAVADHLGGLTWHTFEGLAGGTLLQRPWDGRRWTRDVSRGRSDRAARDLVRIDDGRDRYSFLLRPAMKRQLAPARAIRRIQASLEQVASAPNPALAFRLWNRTIRSLALNPTRILAVVPSVFTPFMDPEFVSFAMSIPVGSVDRSVQEEAIATAFPETAEIRYARFGVPQVSPAFARRIARDLSAILLEDSDGSLIDRTSLLRRTLRGIVHADLWLATGRRPAMITYLVQLERLVREGPVRSTRSARRTPVSGPLSPGRG